MCVSAGSDPQNCGACGNACGAFEVCFAGACLAASCSELHTKDPAAPSGIYKIDVDGFGPKAPFDVYCEMNLAGGGWTLVLNLDTSDGHVMWWGNGLWTNGTAFGIPATALTADHKSEAYSSLTGASEIMLVVHDEGSVIGHKRFAKSNADTLLSHLQGPENTIVGTAVTGADTANLAPQERLVRLSTQLFANHYVTSGSAPDGDRLGSHEAAPQDNDGGGLGNWHDIGQCCAGQTYAGKACNGGAFRTTSEAQGGWGQCWGAPTVGYFGTDTFGPASNDCSDSAPCGNSSWASPNGIAYDYSVWLR